MMHFDGNSALVWESLCDSYVIFIWLPDAVKLHPVYTCTYHWTLLIRSPEMHVNTKSKQCLNGILSQGSIPISDKVTMLKEWQCRLAFTSAMNTRLHKTCPHMLEHVDRKIVKKKFRKRKENKQKLSGKKKKWINRKLKEQLVDKALVVWKRKPELK